MGCEPKYIYSSPIFSCMCVYFHRLQQMYVKYFISTPKYRMLLLLLLQHVWPLSLLNNEKLRLIEDVFHPFALHCNSLFSNGIHSHFVCSYSLIQTIFRCCQFKMSISHIFTDIPFCCGMHSKTNLVRRNPLFFYNFFLF